MKNDEKCGDAGSSALPCQGDNDEFGSYGADITEICDHLPLRFAVIPCRVGGNGFAQMVLDFFQYTAGQRSIEIELARQLFEIILDHAGFSRGRLPASRPAIASENCFQTACRSASARLPALVRV